MTENSKDDKKFNLLMKQYQFCQKNITLQDNAWKRFSIFFTVNSILTAFIGLLPLLYENDKINNILIGWILGISLIVFGICINIIWYKVIEKGSENIKHWPALMREIEGEFKNYFNSYEQKDDRNKIFMLYTRGYELKKKKSGGKTIQEVVMGIPIIFMGLWFIIGLSFILSNY